jgi:hypothetical protein
MNPRSISNAIGNEKVFRSSSYTLVFLMMVCILMTVGNLIQNTFPDWHSGIIAGVILFIVIDRLYTYRQLKSLTPLSTEWVMAHAAQWIVILVFIRFLLSYANGLDSFLTDLSLFARGYIANFFSAEFVITLLLALLVWYLTAEFLTLLDEIGLDVKWALGEESVLIQGDAVPAHQRLVNLIFSLGIGLVILTALTRINLRATFSSPAGMPKVEWNHFSGAEAGALLYFVFGLALLSLSRLMSLQPHGNRLRIPVSSKNLTRQWGMYSLFFLLSLAVIVSLLPAGDSLGFFPVLGTLLGFLLSVLFFIGQLILALVLLLFSLPFLLFGKVPPFFNRSALPVLPRLPVQPAVPIPSSAIWELARSILLWGSLLVILVFAFRQFVEQHDRILATLRKSRITNWLLLAWQWLYRHADQTRASLPRAIADGWQGILARLEGKRSLPRPGWIILRSLDPRQQIYFFYLAMIRRGDEQGLRRKPSQTPSEYAVQLEKALPSASEDIDSITEAFVRARYSRQEVDSRKADLVKATWARIRHAMQRKSKSERSADK